MKNQFINKVNVFILTIVFSSTALLAQEPTGDDPGLPGGGDPGGDPAVSVDNWIPFLLILGICIIFYYTQKKKSITN